MSKSLPLVNLSVLRPLLSALRDREVDPEYVLETAGLTEDSVMRDDITVHVMVVHQFLESCALAVDDPTFCASVGLRLDTAGWPMIETALASRGSLADFLATYVSRANDVATSVTAYLELHGEQATYGEKRLFRPTILPAQNDGFMVGLSVSILRHALGDRFEAGKTTLILCNPRVLPASFSEFPRLKGDEMGFRIKFPSTWLTLPIEYAKSGPHAPDGVNPFLHDFRKLIDGRIDQGGLNAEDAAALVSMSRSKLARRLAAEGTSISDELRRAKLAYARERLASTDQPVDEIASALGYSDPSNFSRAFRETEGMSPRVFRSTVTSGKAPIERDLDPNRQTGSEDHQVSDSLDISDVSVPGKTKL